MTASRSDALGDDDLTGLIDRLRRRECSPTELVQAAIDRAVAVNETLNGLVCQDFERALSLSQKPIAGPLAGIPVVIKDNVEVAGLPTRFGSAAVPMRVARRNDPVAALLRRLGLICIGKSSMSEFGFNASDESTHRPPVCNPHHPGHSAGASSSGSAALVAAGVVPIGHGNDGGGSIRIPASACGLVGLKPTRGRLPEAPAMRRLPVRIVTEGVLTRSVRDTRLFHGAAAQPSRTQPSQTLRSIDVRPGAVSSLRIGVLQHSVHGESTDDSTLQVIDEAAGQLASLGHHVKSVTPPVDCRFGNAFSLYWRFLGWLLVRGGPALFGREFDPAQLENLTRGLAGQFGPHCHKLPGAILRLRRSHRRFREGLRHHDVDMILSPVTTRPAPPLGYLGDALAFEELFDRLSRYVGFTPLANAAGTPAIAVPGGRGMKGIPIGVQLAADRGRESMLLDVAEQLYPSWSVSKVPRG